MNMQMSELMMSSPHNSPFILYTCSELEFYGYVCVNRHVIWQDNLEVQGPCVNPINEIMNGFLVVIYLKL